MYGVSQCPANDTHAPVAWAKATNAWARRSQPISRAIKAATTMAAIDASIAGMRSATMELGAMRSLRAASAGASGG